jgi:hypothetical protein
VKNPPTPSCVRAARVFVLAAAAATALAAAGCSSATPPPPPTETTVVVVRPPKPHPYAVWLQGHYVYHRGRYQWVPGHWSQP